MRQDSGAPETQPQRGPTAGPTESVLWPDLEIVDPHHHLFHHGVEYLLEDLMSDTNSGHNVVQTIYVEDRWAYDDDAEAPEMMPVGEVARVAAIAEASESKAGATIAGIIGHADLRYGSRVGPVLDAMLEISGGRLVGIRHATAFSLGPGAVFNPACDRPNLTRDTTWREGFTELADRGLSFDASIWYPQLEELADLSECFPETPIIVDHLGIGMYFDDRDTVLDITQRSLERLAGSANIKLKLGGIGWPRMSGAWKRPPTSEELAERWAPFVLWCIDTFGADRCMFESNFPVDRQTCSYFVLWNAFKRIAATRSSAERRALFSGSARSIYRLGPNPNRRVPGHV